MAGNLQPLDSKFAIVGPDGRPTDYFTRWAQQRQIDIGEGITLLDLEAFLTAHKLVPGVGIQFAPDGDINNSPTIHADVQAILDEITATRGTILYRGLLGWSALAPGTAGNFLKTNGAGADPTWAAGGGGGGGASIFPIVTPLPTLATWVNQGSSIYTTNTDGSATLMGAAPIGSGDNLQGIFQALTIPYSFTIGFVPCLPGINWQQCGIALRESGSGKIIVFGTYKDAGSALWLSANYNSPISKNANVLTPAAVFAGPVYLQISNDGTTRKAAFGWEPHGQTQMAYSFAAGTFLVENQIGLYVSNANGGGNALKLPITLISWQ